MSPKFPDIEVQLTGRDGNAFAILAATCRAMRSTGCSAADLDEYTREAMAGDYAHLLAVTAATVSVS